MTLVELTFTNANPVIEIALSQFSSEFYFDEIADIISRCIFDAVKFQERWLSGNGILSEGTFGDDDEMIDDEIASLRLDDCQLVGDYRNVRGRYRGRAEHFGR